MKLFYDKGPFPLINGQWDDLRFPAVNLPKNSAQSNPEFDYTELGWNFNDSEDGILHCIAQLSHSWKEGSELHPHIHWIQEQNACPNWQIEYRVSNNGESYTDWQVLTGQNSLFTYESGSISQMTEFDPIDMTGYTISCMLDFKIERIAEDDTYTGLALLKEFDIHYLSNTVGSRQEYVKF